jgi:hypothetical protein
VLDNFKKTTREYRQGEKLYNASLEFIGKIHLQAHKLLVDAFELDEVFKIQEKGTRPDDMKSLLTLWAPKDPQAKYLPGAEYLPEVTKEEAFLHTVIGDVLRTDTFTLKRGARFTVELLNRAFTSLEETQEAHHMRKSMAYTVGYRQFFYTKNGYMGVGPIALRVGDKICGFLGGQMLYAIRPRLKSNLQEYTFLGECYVHGFMDGEALRYRDDGSVESFRVVLV